MVKNLLFLIFVVLVLALPAMSQTPAPFTTGNSTIVTIGGNTENYEHVSPELLVRYNQNTQNVECVLNVASLRPANLSAPLGLVQDVFFASKYPEFILEFKVPAENVTSERAGVQDLECRASVTFQGITNETVIPVQFTSNKQSLVFSSNFDIMIDNFQGSIPAKYLPILNGRITITIQNAQWTRFRLN